ncbi:MAG: PKD domain-containing protein, partial [Planctomycetaceae bacterium]
LRLSPQAQQKLRGLQATYTITGPPAGPQFRSGTFPLTDGDVQIPLDVANASALSADQPYSAVLNVTYPSLPGYDIEAGTVKSVELSFLPGDRPQILQVRPADDAVYPVGAEVLFFVEALQDSTVVWDLGDGVQRTGREVRYRYETPGPRNVRVT